MDAAQAAAKKSGRRALPLPPPAVDRRKAAAAVECNTPRSIFARLLSPRGSGCRVRLPMYCSGIPKEEEEEDEEEAEDGVQEVAGAATAVASGESSRKVSTSDATKPQESPVNLGMSVSLVFLLTKSASELSKMAQLRTEMEAMLAEIKSGMLMKNQMSPRRRECESFYSSTAADVHAERVDDNPGELIDPLEAELEAELKQMELEARAKSAMSDSFEMSYVGDNGGKEEDTAHQDYQEEQESPQHGGVSARELERRLHEVLHQRQQERIAELEAALQCTEKKLHEKEREAGWWRDTARLVSRHKDDSVFR